MKSASILIFLAVPFLSYAQSVDATSHGPCSPNIVSNQTEVQFTCNAAMDANTAKRIVSLLNQILQKENSTADPTGNINHKLDDILNFLQKQAQQSQELAAGVQALQQQSFQRHLTDDQKAQLIKILKADGPQEFYFICAPDPETTYFSNEILAALDSAGWKWVPHPPNWPTFEKPGQGVIVWVAPDVNTDKDAPLGAVALLEALQAVGVDVVAQKFMMMAKDKFGIYIGIKPAPATAHAEH